MNFVNNSTLWSYCRWWHSISFPLYFNILWYIPKYLKNVNLLKYHVIVSSIFAMLISFHVSIYVFYIVIFHVSIYVFYMSIFVLMIPYKILCILKFSVHVKFSGHKILLWRDVENFVSFMSPFVLQTFSFYSNCH
jgi:hypothetical protein